MKNDNSKMVGRRLIRSLLTSVISISLVLFVVALALFAWANTKSLSDFFKENSVVSVILRGNATESQARDLMKKIQAYPFVKNAKYISREQGEEEMKALLGEDFMDLYEDPAIHRQNEQVGIVRKKED